MTTAQEYLEKGKVLLYMTEDEKDIERIDKASKNFNEALKLDPNNIYILYHKAFVAYSTYMKNYQTNLISDSLKTLDSIIEKDIGFTASFFLKALLLYCQDYKVGNNYFQSIGQMDANNEESWYSKAKAIDKMSEGERESKTKEILTLLMNMNVNQNFDAFKELIYIMINKKQYKEALEKAESFIKANPDVVLGHKSKCRILEANNQYEAADQAADQWIKFINKDVEIYDSDGPFHFKNKMLMQIQKYDSALENASQWLKITPNDLDAYDAKMKALNAQDPIKIEKFFLFLKDNIMNINIDEFMRVSRNRRFMSYEVNESIVKYIRNVLDSIINTFANKNIEPFCSGLLTLEIKPNEIIDILDQLINKATDKFFEQFCKEALLIKGCLLYASKNFEEAKKCLENEKLEACKSWFFKDYCIAKLYLDLGQMKNAWVASEKMMNYCYYQGKYNWSYVIPQNTYFVFQNGKDLRTEILNESLLKEINSSKRKEIKKEAEELLNKALSLTFNGQEENYLKAIEFLDQALKIDQDSVIIPFYKCLLECIEKKKSEEIWIPLNEIIKKDVGFLPAYYLKNYAYKEGKSSTKKYYKTIKALKPNDQDSFFLKILVTIQLKNKINKTTFDYLEKCTDQRFERKALELRRIYYEKQKMKEKALETATEYMNKYPAFNESLENLFKILVDSDKIEEAISWALKLKKVVSNTLNLTFPVFLNKLEESCYTEKGFILNFDAKKLLEICEFIINYDEKNLGLISNTLNFKGCLLLLSKNNEEAYTCFEKAISFPLPSNHSSYSNSDNNLNSYEIKTSLNSFFHVHLCKVANLLQKFKIAQSSCDKAFGYITLLCDFRKIYYKNILMEEYPKIYTESFRKLMKERKPEIINEKAMPFYEKGLKLLGYIRPTDNQKSEAMKHFDEALKLAKDSHLILFQKSKLSKESNVIDQFIETDPLFFAAYYHKLNRITEGEKKIYYEMVKDFEPNENDEESCFQKGEYLFIAKRYQEAIPYFQRLSLNYIKAFFHKAKCYIELKQKEKAEEIYDLMIKTFPEIEEGYLQKSNVTEFKGFVEILHIWGKKFANSKILMDKLSNFCEKEGTPEEKLEVSEIFCTYFPLEYRSRSAFLKCVEFSAYDASGFNLKKFKYTKEQILNYCNNENKNETNLIQNIKGSVLMAMNKYEEALQCFENCVEKLPSYALYHCNKGVALSLLNKPKSALPAFERAYSSLQMNKIAYTLSDNSSSLTKEYVKSTIEKERKKILLSLIDEINKHSITKDDVKVLEQKFHKLERQMTLQKIDENDDIMKDIKMVNEKLIESDKAVEKLTEEKERLLKSVENNEKPVGIIELTAQVESWKKKADLAKGEKDKLENHYKELEAKVNLLFKNVEKVNEKVENVSTEVNKTSEKVVKIEVVQKEESKKLEEHENVLKEGGVYAKVELKKNFLALQTENPEIYAYGKTFYWTMLNYFGAYRNLSSDLFKKNVDVGQDTSNLIVEGMKKAAQFGTEIAKGVPFVGGIIGGLDNVIDTIYGTYKEKKFDYKVKIVNKIIQIKFTLEEDISLELGKLAINMANLRKDEIFKDQKESKTGKIWNWLNERMENLSKLVFPFVEVNSEKGAKMALKDIVALFAYIFKNHELICIGSDPLYKQFENIIIHGFLDNFIKESEEGNIQNETISSNTNEKLIKKTVSNKKNKKGVEQNESNNVKKKKSSKCSLI